MNAIQLYYLDKANQPQGPFAPRQLNDLRKLRVINWDTPVAEEGAEEWASLSTYADLVDAGTKLNPMVASASGPTPNQSLYAAGSGLQALGVAVTLVNPIVGVGMIVAGSKVKKAGES